jgi:NTE family protein
VDQYVPFTGVNFLQKYGYYSLVARMKLQYNVYKKIYLTVRADGGANVTEANELFSSRNYLFGYGMTASYDSFIGPVEISIMGSNINPKPTYFLNIGFWF